MPQPARHVLPRPSFCSRSRPFVPPHVVACLLVSPRSVWVGTLACVGSGSRMYDDGKSGRCRFVGDRTCSIFNDHVAVSDLRSVFTIPSSLPIRLHHTPRVTCIPPRATLPCTRAPLLSSNSYTQTMGDDFLSFTVRVSVYELEERSGARTRTK